MKIATQELVNSSQKPVIEFVDYTGEKLLRGSTVGSDEAFILDL